MTQRSSVNYPCIKFRKNPPNGLVSGEHLQVTRTDRQRVVAVSTYSVISYFAKNALKGMPTFYHS